MLAMMLSLTMLQMGPSKPNLAEPITLSNGSFEVTVEPALGRIMRYGPVGGPNLLWDNRDKVAGTSGWANYGGDKLWTAPQSQWGWPPDVAIDGSPHFGERNARGIYLRSRPGAKIPVVMERWISLAPSSSLLTIKNRMTYLGERPLEVAPWQVIQIDDPDRVIMPLHQGEVHLYGAKELLAGYADRTESGLVLRRHPTEGRKYGGWSRTGWLRSEKGAWAFIAQTRYVVGAKYADEGSAQQVYLNPDPSKYVELEFTAPLRTMHKGNRAEFTVIWRLEPVGR